MSVQTRGEVAARPAGEQEFNEWAPVEDQNQYPRYPGKIVVGRVANRDVLLYIGIVDALCPYRFRDKVLRCCLKVFNGRRVYVQKPSVYSRRLQNYVARSVFRRI